MAYSYDQPELHSDYILVSSPRIFIRDYAASVLYSGQSILNVSSPLSGWSDAGLISNVSIPVTRNIVKLQLGLPKTTRKAFELSREAQVTLTFHEMHVDTIQQLTGANQANVISGGVIASQANDTNAISTLDTAQEANRFVVGDQVSFWDVYADELVGLETITAVSAAAKTVTVDGTWATPPAADDILLGKVGVVASYNGATPAIVLEAGGAARFAVGDRVVFVEATDDCLDDARAETDRVYITAINAGTETLTLSAAFTGTPVATDLLIAYKSIELLDPLGNIAEKSLLLFFDSVVNNVQRQIALWYPKVTVAGSWAPDFKGGENYMDASLTFEVQSTTQITADGSSNLVLQIPFIFD